MLKNVIIASGLQQFALDHDLLSKLMDFYLGSSSPLCQSGEKRTQMGNRVMTPVFDPLIKLISELINYKLTKNIDFTDKEKKCLFCREFINKTLKDNYCP